MPDTATPETLTRPADSVADAAEPPQPATFNTPNMTFGTLASVLASYAIEASDRGDYAEFQRALAYRTAVKRLAERWQAGEASPVRNSPKEEG